MHFSRQLNCWSLRCSWSIACRRCSNYIFILNLTPGFNGLGKDNYNMRREAFKFWNLVHLILETLRYTDIQIWPFVNFHLNTYNRHSLLRARCGMSFVSLKSNLSSATPIEICMEYCIIMLDCIKMGLNFWQIYIVQPGVLLTKIISH